MAQVYKSAGIITARIGGQSAEMDAAASRAYAAAQSLAAAHFETGSYASKITPPRRVPGKNGVTDRMVSATDPASLPIEFGHMTRRGAGMHGPQRHVPGLHIMARAADAV